MSVHSGGFSAGRPTSLVTRHFRSVFRMSSDEHNLNRRTIRWTETQPRSIPGFETVRRRSKRAWTPWNTLRSSKLEGGGQEAGSSDTIISFCPEMSVQVSLPRSTFPGTNCMLFSPRAEDSLLNSYNDTRAEAYICIRPRPTNSI